MPFTIPFRQIKKDDILSAGGKGANLGELTAAGFPVPPGFVVKAEAYQFFVQTNDLQPQIINLAQKVSPDDLKSVVAASAGIRELFWKAEIPEELTDAIVNDFTNLGLEESRSKSSKQAVKTFAVAVRSSGTAEDLPTASFAGQYDTFLNIQNEKPLLESIKNCWASLWTARAISYRIHQEIDPTTVGLAVIVQKFIPADTAGILFTANPMDGDRDRLVINATWGLGEAIVGGQVIPDTVVVDKSTTVHFVELSEWFKSL